MAIPAPFVAAQHPRGAGGLFSATSSAAAGRPTGAWAAGPMRYNAAKHTGTGYGQRGGDARVKALQTALNKLGLKDERGRPLAVDGRLGPHTTAAVRAAQKRLGLPVDGVVSAQVMLRILTAKPAAPSRPTPRGTHRSAGHGHAAHPPASRAKPKRARTLMNPRIRAY